MIANHRRTKRHQPSKAITVENSYPEVTKVVSSSAKDKECDTEPTRATQRKPGAAQSLREASVADTEGHRADAGHLKADADPSRVTHNQREAERG